MSKKIFILMSLLLIFLAILSVKVSAETTKFTFEKDNIEVVINGSKYISYSGGTGNITWTSSDPSVATVEGGTVKGLKIGETTITATRGEETATCKVKVVYDSIKIGGNEGEYVSKVNLILNEHETENLLASVKDSNFEEVSNAEVTWTSSNDTIVTVEKSSGKIKALKSGKATITATVVGATNSVEVNVYDAPVFTDFSNAKYETTLEYYSENLKISGVTPKDDFDNGYYFIITSNNTKPELIKDRGSVDQDAMSQKVKYLNVNAKENYLYTRDISSYSELNQDLYLWVIQDVKLQDYYYDSVGKYISHSSKYVVEGKKITRATLPLNLILQTFNIGSWNDTTKDQGETESTTYMNFNFPSATENRKFTVKIGKVTDKSILSKIQKNDYSGIQELLTYAKKNSSVFSKQLTTTSIANYRYKDALFDGRKLLEDKQYYYIYIEFDDENGKYYPVEGVTLGQAWFSTSSSNWDLWAYTKSEFKWDDLSSTYTPTDEEIDNTTATGKLPQTGTSIVIYVAMTVVIIAAVILAIKYKRYNIKY